MHMPVVLTMIGVIALGVPTNQVLSPDSVIDALRHGGYVLVMRHASSPQAVPDKQTANPDNEQLERQLDAAGRRGAAAMGEALRRLNVPVGAVFTSPTYRARETVKFAGLANPRLASELGDGGQSMQGVPEAQAAWLRAKVAEVPTQGNTILVTHLPNISRAFPAWGSVADGETVIVRPDGKGGMNVVARIKIEEWAGLRRRWTRHNQLVADQIR
jgi:phosphohistidine phosphatase SixA